MRSFVVLTALVAPLCATGVFETALAKAIEVVHVSRLMISTQHMQDRLLPTLHVVADSTDHVEVAMSRSGVSEAQSSHILRLVGKTFAAHTASLEPPVRTALRLSVALVNLQADIIWHAMAKTPGYATAKIPRAVMSTMPFMGEMVVTDSSYSLNSYAAMLRVLCALRHAFANPELASALLSELPLPLRNEVIARAKSHYPTSPAFNSAVASMLRTFVAMSGDRLVQEVDGAHVSTVERAAGPMRQNKNSDTNLAKVKSSMANHILNSVAHTRDVLYFPEGHFVLLVDVLDALHAAYAQSLPPLQLPSSQTVTVGFASGLTATQTDTLVRDAYSGDKFPTLSSVDRLKSFVAMRWAVSANISSIRHNHTRCVPAPRGGETGLAMRAYLTADHALRDNMLLFAGLHKVAGNVMIALFWRATLAQTVALGNSTAYDFESWILGPAVRASGSPVLLSLSTFGKTLVALHKIVFENVTFRDMVMLVKHEYYISKTTALHRKLSMHYTTAIHILDMTQRRDIVTGECTQAVLAARIVERYVQPHITANVAKAEVLGSKPEPYMPTVNDVFEALRAVVYVTHDSGLGVEHNKQAGATIVISLLKMMHVLRFCSDQIELHFQPAYMIQAWRGTLCSISGITERHISTFTESLRNNGNGLLKSFTSLAHHFVALLLWYGKYTGETQSRADLLAAMVGEHAAPAYAPLADSVEIAGLSHAAASLRVCTAVFIANEMWKYAVHRGDYWKPNWIPSNAWDVTMLATHSYSNVDDFAQAAALMRRIAQTVDGWNEGLQSVHNPELLTWASVVKAFCWKDTSRAAFEHAAANGLAIRLLMPSSSSTDVVVYDMITREQYYETIINNPVGDMPHSNALASAIADCTRSNGTVEYNFTLRISEATDGAPSNTDNAPPVIDSQSVMPPPSRPKKRKLKGDSIPSTTSDDVPSGSPATAASVPCTTPRQVSIDETESQSSKRVATGDARIATQRLERDDDPDMVDPIAVLLGLSHATHF